jgi:alanine racemase
MAVVKADAYGHGLVPVARAALQGGAEWLAVALVEEGVALRTAGIEAPILVLSEPPAAAAGALLAARLTPAVYTPQFLSALDDGVAASGGAPVEVHLKLDTGMRRVGAGPAAWDAMFRAVRRARHVRVEALWSHLAVADQPGHPFTRHQAGQFARGIARARSLGLRPPLLHLCNSAATLCSPELHHDLVRTGLAMYGLEPAPGLAKGVGLRPALAWYTRLGLVKALRAGAPVGYGLRWRPARDTVVGTLPVGYADGLRRGSDGHAVVAWQGRTVALAGAVSMDQAVVDLGPQAGESNQGDGVALIGSSGSARVTADDWARWWGTISYEVVCGIGARVPRVHLAPGADDLAE